MAVGVVCTLVWAACSPGSSGAPPARHAGRSEVPVESKADSHTLRSGPGGRYRVRSYASGTPTHLVVRAEAFPYGGTATSDPLRGCPVEVLLYSTTLDPSSVAWRSTAAPGGTCAGAKRVQGSAASEIELGYDLRGVLGDSLVPGYYRTDVIVGSGRDRIRFTNDRVYLWPDTLPPVPSLAPLRFTAAAEVHQQVQPTLGVTVTARNAGKERVEIGFGACAVRVTLHQPGRVTDRAVWDSSVGEACPAYSAGAVLSPGESRQPREFRTEIPMSRIKVSRVPPGTYAGFATLHLTAGRNDAHADSIRLPLGSIQIR